MTCHRLRTLLYVAFLGFSAQASATVSIALTGYTAARTPIGGSEVVYYYSNIGPGYTSAATPCSTAANPNCKNPTDLVTITASSDLTATGTIKIVVDSTDYKSTTGTNTFVG